MTDSTNDPGRGLSSEELIRQARAPYEPDAMADSVAAPADPVRAEPREPMSRSAVAEDLARPADGIGATYTEPATAPPPWEQAPDYRYEERRPSFLQRFGWLILVAVIGLGGWVWSVFDNTKSVEALDIGDCLLMPELDEISSVESTDCSEPHELEVFALIEVPDGNDAPYPGDFELAERMYEMCLGSFDSYVGIAYTDSIWWVDVIYPTQQSWEEASDREGSCVLMQQGDDFEALTVTGSARLSRE